ncbi:MAG: hypothetical protein JSV42_13465 [Chloroflexota bacterium]|nr:MAG: hypothetical protein JSV42_13465 [Chloroflexota bacterium]
MFLLDFLLIILVPSKILLGMNSVIAAYIDPNTGGMLFQILAVLFGVISGALLLFSGKVKGLYYRVKRRIQNPDSAAIDEVPGDDGDD